MELECLAVGNVFLQSHGADSGDNLFCYFDVGNDSFIDGLCFGQLCNHNAFAVFALCNVLPEFFGDEGHKGMEQTEQVVEECQCSIHSGAVDGLSVGGFYHFEIPRREFVPEQFVDSHQGFRQAEFAEQVGNFGKRLVEDGVEPADGDFCVFGLFDVGNIPPFDEAERIPYLVVEVTTLGAERFVEEDVVACGCRKHHAHTHAVGAVTFHQFYRVGRAAERFRHLSAQLIAHDTGEIDISERHLAGELITRHDHTRHPEEYDIRGCNKIRSGIIILELLIVGIEDAVE